MNPTKLVTNSFLNDVVATSTKALLVFQVNRASKKTAVDPILSMLSRFAQQDLAQPVDALLGHTFEQLFPHLRGTELANRYGQVVKTGQSDQVAFFSSGFRSTQLPTLGGYQVLMEWLGDFLIVSYDHPIQDTLTGSAFQPDEASLPGAPLLDERLASLVPVGIALLSAVRDGPDQPTRIRDFQLTQINSHLTAILGQSAAQGRGDWLTTFFPQAIASGLLSRCLSSVAFQQTQHFDMPLGSLNQTGWYQLSIIPQGDQLILAVTDITDLKGAQLAHHQQAEWLRSVLEGSQNAILAFEAIRSPQQLIVDFRYVPLHALNERRPGQPPGMVAGNTLLALLPTVVDNDLLAQLVAVVSSGQPLRCDVGYDDGTGPGWFDWSVVKRQDGIVLTIMDKTSERMATQHLQVQQRHLEGMNSQLQRSNENLRQFAFVASHDLQEPLRKIHQFGELLRNQYGLELGTGLAHLTRMQSAASRMSTLIRDLLSFSQLSTQNEPFTWVSLPGLVGDILEELDLDILAIGAVVTLGELPIVVGHVSQLTQLFSNLLSNALKFREPGIPVAIQISAQILLAAELPPGISPLHLTARYHRIEVIDNGIGFDEKYLDRIFRVFQRLHGTNSYPGTGIGLAICEKVVTNHGGALTAHSQVGQGAAFRVYLPL